MRPSARGLAQYSSARMIVSTRVVTAASVGSGEPVSAELTVDAGSLEVVRGEGGLTATLAESEVARDPIAGRENHDDEVEDKAAELQGSGV